MSRMNHRQGTGWEAMLLFAEISAEGYAVIIAAVCIGIGGVIMNALTLILAHLDRKRLAEREEARIIREQAAAAKVEEVRLQATRAAVKVDEVRVAAREVAVKVEEVAQAARSQDAKLDALTANVEAVHKATNSLTDKLVETTGVAAFAAGVKSETDKKGGG